MVEPTSLRERFLKLARPTGKEGTLPLFLDGLRIGTLTTKNLDCLSRHAMGRFFVTDGLQVMLTSGKTSLDAVFAQLAESLRENVLQRDWRNELLDVIPYGESTPIARAERALFRFLGMATRSVYAIAKDSESQWLLAKRSIRKPIDPGLWDALAAGLVSCGETPFDALQRETFEEAGLQRSHYDVLPQPVHSRVVEREVPEGWLREQVLYFPMSVHSEIEPQNQDGEVERFLRCDTRQLLTLIDNDQLTLGAALGHLFCTSETFP